MKIKRKPPKPARNGRPAFIIGWSFSLPTITDLKFWFDLEYGGPLKVVPESGTSASSARLTLSHALWLTSLICPLPEEDARFWQDQLRWGHTQAAAVLHRQVPPPAQSRDVQLFLSRLARGLTLLSEGTSYDVHTASFLNPSDWKDRRLDSFNLDDHLTVQQSDSEDPTSDWFRTMGLGKFGLDELETSRPRGLTTQPTIEALMELAGEVMRTGHNPTVGSTLSAPPQHQPVQVVAHRTIPHTTGTLALRRVRW